MTRDWLDILQEMDQWSRDLDRFMTHVNTRSQTLMSTMNSLTWSPAVNIYETDDALLVLIELAGVEAEEVNVKYENNRLLVWGQRRQFLPNNVRALHRMETEIGPFAFVIELPGHFSSQGAEADLKDGLLEIRLPKRTEKEHGPVMIRPTGKAEDVKEVEHDRNK